MSKPADPRCLYCRGTGQINLNDGRIAQAFSHIVPCRCTADEPDETTPMRERYI